MNEAYMPAPSRNATRFVVHTPRMRIIVMSTSGLSLCTSTATQATHTSAPKQNRAPVCHPPQPHTVVWANGIGLLQTQIDISDPGSQFTRPGARIGDSGMKRQVNTAA